MLINNTNKSNEGHVEFISYTGAWPNLCSGVLTLKIDGEEYKFGHDYRVWNSYKTDGNYHGFWHSGGTCGFTNGYSDSYCNHDEWKINVDEIPEQFRKYASEIDYVFNSNVPFGCCGGCL